MITSITFDDILLVPRFNKFASRLDVDISMVDKRDLLELGLPIISANMDTITDSTMANFMGSRGGIGALHRFMSIEENLKEFLKCKTEVIVSCGLGEKELERVSALKDAGATYFLLDIAHAHSSAVSAQMKTIRQIIGDRCLIAGNVATREGAQFLVDNGADIVKVGIGGGSACTTRIKTGFGVPTLQSIYNCASIDRSIIADGGIRSPGDIVKALALGADFVMIGGMLAGTDQTPPGINHREMCGDNFWEPKALTFRGMASAEAVADHFGEMDSWKTAEGISHKVPYRGSAESVINDIIGGLRSGLTYGGAENFKVLQKTATYNQITQAGKIESLPHIRGEK